VPGSQLSYLDNQTVKGTYQASRAYKIVGFFSRHGELFPERFGSRLIPYENTRKFTWNPHQFKGEMQGMPTNGFLFNVFFGRNRYDANYYAQPDAKNPTSLDNTTQLNLGPNLAQDRRPRSSWQSTGSASFFPASEFLGKHELKSGFTYYSQYSGTGQPNGLHGNYQLVFDTINGVRHQPLQIVTYNYPLSPTDRLNEGGVYGQDTWRLGKRTTLNLGLRFDSFHTWVPPQTKEAGQFAEASTFPEVQTGVWRNFAPRFGVVFNVTSDGKTALKATWGRFNHTPGDDFAANFDKNAVTTTTYRWRDLNGNGDYDSGEVDLNTNGPDFLSTSGAAATVFDGTANRNLKEPHTDEGTLTFEREVMANVGARVNYVYSKQVGVFQQVNILRPYSAWTTQIQRQDPGPDGVIGTADDGGFVTIYDYDPAYRGSAFVANQFQNRPADTFQTIEATLTRRTTDRWGVLASFAGIKNRRHLSAAPASAIIQNPNQDYFPLDTTWNWQGKITGSYQLPWALNLSGTYQIYNGVLGQRTYIFRNIPVSSTVTIPLEAFGARSGPVRDLLNLRVAKDVSLAAQRRLKLSLELLNALNSSDPWAISYASGPTFGQFTQTNTPRICRGGVTFSF
jgi:hypothetical protein